MQTNFKITEVLSPKLDSSSRNYEHHVYFIERIIGLRETIDGFTNSINLLSDLLEEFEFLQDKVPTEIKESLLFFKKNIQLFPGKSATLSKDNPRFGKYEKNEILACWSQRVFVKNNEQRRTVRILLGCLLLWRINNPASLNDSTIVASNGLNNLCSKIRRLSSRYVLFDWPGTNIPPSDALKSISAAAYSDNANEFSKVKTELNSLIVEFNKPRTPRSITTRSITIDERDDIDIYEECETQLSLVTDNTEEEPSIEMMLSESSNFSNDFEFTYKERGARLASSQYRSAMHNQYLPFDWRFLNSFEIERLIPIILESKCTNSIVSILTIVTSLTVKELFEVYLCHDKPEDRCTSYISISDNSWTTSFPTLPGRFRATEKNREHLAKCSSSLTLPLPTILHNCLRELGTGHLGTLLRFKDPQSMQDSLDNFLLEVKKNAGIRLSRLKLRTLIFNKLNALTNDPIRSALIISNDEHCPSVAFYYASFESNELQLEYQAVLSKIGIETTSINLSSDQSRYGSEAFWHLQQHRQCLDEIYLAVTNVTSDLSAWKSLAEYHNRFASLTTWMILCGTGHRQCEQVRVDLENINEHWCVIQDKSKQYENSRLVRLCTVLQQQMRFYCEHLQALAQLVKHHDNLLAKKIGSLTDYPAPNLADMPLFFLLSPTTLGKIETIGTQQIWEQLSFPRSIPRNVSRHWFVTGLREESVPPEWISDGAGHSGVGQIPFSASSFYSPDTIAEIWDKCVSQWMERLGLKSVKGLQPIPNKRVSRLSNEERLQSYGLSKLITPQRNVNISETIALELEAIKNTYLSEQLPSVDDLLLSLSVKYDWSKADQKEAKQTFAAFEEDADTKTDDNSDKRAQKLITVENSSIKKNHLLHVQQAVFLRENFVKNIPSNLSNTPSEQLYALISLSLRLNALVLAQDEHSALLSQISTSINLYKNYHWLEWTVDSRLLRRFADPITMLLIRHAQHRLLPGKPSLKSAIADQLNEIIKDSFLFRTTDKREYFQILCVAMESWAYHFLPGSAAAVACGRIKMACLPEHNILRLLTGDFIQADEQAQITADHKPIVVSRQKRIEKHQTLSLELKKLNVILDLTREGINKSDEFPSAKHYRKELIGRVASLKQEWLDTNKPSLLCILADYASYLLKQKGKNKTKYLVHNTLSDYLNSCAKPLLYLSQAFDWLSLDSDELEDIYVEALSFSNAVISTNARSKQSRQRRAKRLRYFHDFCVREYEQDPLDLASLDPDYYHAGGRTRVKASFVTFKEYAAMKQIILSDEAIVQSQKDILLLFLILIFRFALRVADALGLDTSDVDISNTDNIIYVRKNKINSPKSRAGFRQVIAAELSDDELILLKSRLVHLSARYNGETCALFSRNDSPWGIVSRSVITKRLLALVKFVTGSAQTNIHSSRHTRASAESNAIMLLPDDALYSEQDWTQFRSESYQQKLLGHDYPTKRIAYAIANQMGHASIQTTLESYTHTFDLILESHLRKYQQKVSAAHLARLATLEGEAVRQMRHRCASQYEFEQKLIRAAYLSDGYSIKHYQTFDPLAITFSLGEIEQGVITISTLDAIVSSITLGADADTIAQHYGLAFDVARTVLDTLAVITETIQFPKQLLKKRIFSLSKNKRKRSHEILKTLNHQKDEVIRLTHIWEKNFNSNITGILITDKADKNEFINIVKRFKDFDISLRAASANNELDVLERSSQYRSKVVVRHNRVNSEQIFIIHKRDKSKAPRLMQSIHKVMLLFYLQDRIKQSHKSISFTQ